MTAVAAALVVVAVVLVPRRTTVDPEVSLPTIVGTGSHDVRLSIPPRGASQTRQAPSRTRPRIVNQGPVIAVIRTNSQLSLIANGGH